VTPLPSLHLGFRVRVDVKMPQHAAAPPAHFLLGSYAFLKSQMYKMITTSAVVINECTGLRKNAAHSGLHASDTKPWRRDNENEAQLQPANQQH